MPQRRFRCLACTHQGDKFPNGVCPACGSPDIRRNKPLITTEVKAKKRYRISLGTVLWIYLLIGLYRQFWPD